MITNWLLQRIGLGGLNDRLDREIAERHATLAIQDERVRAAETLAITSVTAVERMDRQIRVLQRVARSGAARLNTLDAQSRRKSEIIKALEEEVGRLKAALVVLESRLDTDTEQARRGIEGLFARIEATRGYGMSSNAADPPTH